MKILVDPDLCRGSGECAKACPQRAIQVREGRAVIDHDKCDLDGICIPACPFEALSLEE